jgi:uncharacterized membrane protein YphA (DoxX/SURF4 family)
VGGSLAGRLAAVVLGIVLLVAGIAKRADRGWPQDAAALGTPAWAIVQWGVHGGLLWTTGIWLVLIWDFHWRPASRMRGPLFDSASEDRDRNRLMGCLRPVGKSAVLFGLVFLLAGVGAATHWIEILQSEYDERIARLGDPAWDLKQAGLNSLESEVPWPIRKLVPPQIE